MNYEIVTLNERVIVGTSARTGNNDPGMSAVIGGLWQSFYESGICSSVKNKVNPYAICLYSDYEGDTYCVTVGNEVSKAENPELTIKVIPAGNYAKYTIHGNMITDVARSWSEIWQADLDRSYTGDFEEYLNADMENALVDIYIALK